MTRIVLALAMVAAVATSAHADPGAVEGALTTEDYLIETVTLEQGKDLLFVNLDPLQAHTVTSWDMVDGIALFDSGDIHPRSTRTISEVATLPPGEYGFYCAKHVNMSAVLKIV